MKKTLLSIITMATLVGSMAAYAKSVTKDIPVSVEIEGVITLADDKDNDFSTDGLKLTYDTAEKKHTLSQAIKITSNTGGKVIIGVRQTLELIERDDASKKFDNVKVSIGDVDLTNLNKSDFALTNNMFEGNLNITGGQPDGVLAGEVYSGTLQLGIEASA
ncbi:alpha-related fimbriae minor subunit 1 [Yersinia frederiksenii]|uniref:CS1 type fimbrial major subunit n=1 Tax=Yersinia alsatica TaxID=2890317 RepID=UPI0005E1DC85|nr:CS1 type fimbrial major subunit [Yersinia alsatica]CNI52626.1 alpha-related fimbriae minor subunit 1 [Yersinia frederiksenii]